MQPGSQISYFGNNDLSLLQFRPDGNNNRNCSGHLGESKKMRIAQVTLDYFDLCHYIKK